MPPPSASPPNTDNNGNLNTKSGGESKEEGIALAVGLSVGVLALLCCVCAIAWRVCKKRKEDKEQVLEGKEQLQDDQESQDLHTHTRSEFKRRMEALNPDITHAGPLPRSNSNSSDSNSSDSNTSGTSNTSSNLRRKWLGHSRGDLSTDPDEVELQEETSNPNDLGAISAADCKASCKADAQAKSCATTLRPGWESVPAGPETPIGAAQEWLANKVSDKERSDKDPAP